MATWFWQNSKLVIDAQIAARQHRQLSLCGEGSSTKILWGMVFARAMKIGILGNGFDTTEKKRK